MIEGILLAGMITLDIPKHKQYPYGYRVDTYKQMWLVCHDDEPRWRFNSKFEAIEWIQWMRLGANPTYHVKKDQCDNDQSTRAAAS